LLCILSLAERQADLFPKKVDILCDDSSARFRRDTGRQAEACFLTFDKGMSALLT